jgi:tyrosyl-tRNA synthetase
LLGVDPTANAIHLGNLSQIVTGKQFIAAGHTVCLVIGGGTARIGDPSGRSLERPLLVEEQIAANTAALLRDIPNLFTPTEQKQLHVLNNNDWLGHVSLIEFLRDTGKHFRLGTMLGKDSVRSRLQDQGISFTEFAYMLLQAFDFHHLHATYGVTVQIGGSDQWGNITAGIDLIGRRADPTLPSGAVHGVTTKLLTNSKGEKLGKSAGNALWLTGPDASPYALYQFLRNVPDSDVLRLLSSLTLLSLPTEEEYDFHLEEDPRYWQKILAVEVVRICHGEEGVQAALAQSAAAFSSAAIPPVVDGETLALWSDYDSFADVLIAKGGAPSKKAARRLVDQGGVKLNGEKVPSWENLEQRWTESKRRNEPLHIRAGKRVAFWVSGA